DRVRPHRLRGLRRRGVQARRALCRPRPRDLQAVREPDDPVEVTGAPGVRRSRKGILSKARPACGRAFAVFGGVYCATRSRDRLVPIALKVATIWSAVVNRKNLSGPLAQFRSSVEVGSPPVFTWIV